MNKISQSIIDKIKKSGLKPKPKWQFVLWHVLLWVVFVLSIILGSLAFAMILGVLFSTQWGLIGQIGGGPIRGLFLVLPYIWLAALALILFVANILFKRTKHGYRIKPVYVVIASILISLCIGVGLYAGKAHDVVERSVRENIKPYAAMQERREKMLVAPEKGIIAGKIVEIKSDTIFILNAVTDDLWSINIRKDARTIPLKVGLPVVVVGEQTGENEFLAKGIRPWERMGQKLRKPPQ